MRELCKRRALRRWPNRALITGVSRQHKTPKLFPVDETAKGLEEEPCFRLDPKHPTSGELAPTEEHAIRLEAPAREIKTLRSNEPSIETLITGEQNSLEGLESEWGQAAVERRPLPWGWFALIAVVLAGGALWSLKHIIFSSEELQVIRIETESILETEETSMKRARGLIGQIEISLSQFCLAQDVDAMVRTVRHPHRVRPLMDDYYARNPFQPLGPATIETLRPLTLGTHGDFWVASLSFENGKKRNFIVQANEEKPALIDWETAVTYQPMAWDDFAKKRPVGKTMDFRVYLEPDSHYSHEFQDSTKWDCYLLTALDSEEILFGYVQSDSPSAQLFRTWFQRSPSERASMILRLSIPEGLTSPRGVVIDHALSVRWIYLASPEGGS